MPFLIALIVFVTLSVLIRSEAARGCVGKGCGIILLEVLASIGLWILGDVLDSPAHAVVVPRSPSMTRCRPMVPLLIVACAAAACNKEPSASDYDGITMRTAAAKAVDACLRAGST